jgi:hypothetical protein
VGKIKTAVIVAAALLVLVVVVLWIAGTIDDVYRWLVRYFQPEVWSAIATWLTLAVAVGAFLYAKQQVAEARRTRVSQENQAREALTQQAKLSRDALEQQADLSRESLDKQAEMLREQIAQQAEIAQKSLDEQANQAQKTRDEVAQPNVVMYAEPNPVDWQQLEVVIKNFGNTPAYDVAPTIEPPLQSLPNNLSNEEYYTIPIPPIIPVLAPGQEWRTFWDDAVERNEHEGKIRYDLAQIPQFQATGLDLEPEIASRMPASYHTGSVSYQDGKTPPKAYTTRSILDFHMLKGAMRMKTFGIHDIAKKYVEDR